MYVRIAVRVFISETVTAIVPCLEYFYTRVGFEVG